jgi:hypothetical protein
MREVHCKTSRARCMSAHLNLPYASAKTVRYTFRRVPFRGTYLEYTGHPGDYVVGDFYSVTYETGTGMVTHLCSIPQGD